MRPDKAHKGGEVELPIDDTAAACGAGCHAAKYRLVVEHTHNMVVITDRYRRIEYVNPAYTVVTGWALSEVVGRQPGEFLHGPLTCRTTLNLIRDKVRAGEPVEQAELVNYRKDGSPYWVQLNIQPVRGADGEVCHFVAVQADVTAQRRAREALEAGERRMREALSLARMAGFEYALSEHVMHWTPGAEAILGGGADELPRHLDAHIARVEPQDRGTLQAAYREVERGPYEIEYRVREASGRTKWLRERGYLDRRDATLRLSALVCDVTDGRLAQDRIDYLSWHDTLTGLANREQLQSVLRQRLSRRSDGSPGMALLFIDLDRFKTINDSLGHSAGDEVLKLIAQRLKAAVRSDDLVARLGGDEFVVLLVELHDETVVAPLAAKMLAALAEPMRVHDHDLHVAASIGLSLYPDHGGSAAELMRHADAALHAAKAVGQGAVVTFRPELHALSAQRFALESKLRLALPQQEFSLRFQPQFAACGGVLLGFEALIRWTTSAGEAVPPDQFIPLAEQTGLIRHIGDWVAREACRHWRTWADAGGKHLRIAINLSADELHDVALPERLSAHLQTYGLPPGTLELELTESVAMRDPARCIEQMNRLREAGVSWAVDDFGTGYSSLAYLKTLPIQRIKLDRAFVKDLERSANDRAICSAAIEMAHALGLELVAEGIETEAQRQFLACQGCDVMQGYYLGRPETADDALARVRFHAGG
jgi:diguanylate cyclase (GGDEF)-like protein/PAS domain S-box-containing protein